MAYIPTEWKNGDTITAEKLNKLENKHGDIEDMLDDLKESLEDQASTFKASMIVGANSGELYLEEDITKFLPNAANEELVDFNILGINRQTGNLEWYAPEDMNLLPSANESLNNSTLILTRSGESNELEWINIDGLKKMLSGCGE